MKGWREYKLEEIGEVLSGGTPNTKIPEFWVPEIPWITPKDLSNHKKRYISFGERFISKKGLENSNAKLLPKGTVLLSSRAPIGYIAIAENEISTNQGFQSIVTNEKVFNEFLYYLLKANSEYLKSLGEGTTFGEISNSTVRSIKFKFPPLPEQKAIAAVLSSLDDKIDLLHRQNKTLEAMAETLFRQWFVEPCKNWLPEGWEEGKLPDEFDFTMGASPPGESYNEDGRGIPMFQGNADFGFRFPQPRVYTTAPIRFAKKYDTLISVRAPVGEQNMAQEECCIGRGVATFRYKNENNSKTYVYYKLKSLMTEIKSFNDTGTVFGSISKTDFESIEITIPPKSLILQFEVVASPIDNKIINNCHQIEKLEKLRDTLLPKLMSGEVRVEV